LDISNIIVVRFSLKLSPKWLETAYGDESNRPAWLKMRADLFDRTIYESAKRQTVRPKAIVLLMDKGDEGFFKERFAGYDMLVPAFGSHPDHYGQSLDAISEIATKNDAISRCDSDDLVASNYLETVNKTISEAVSEGKAFEFVVATRGFTTNGAELQEIYYSCSPFLTMFKPEWDRKNIYSFNHEDVLQYPHVATDRALWMQYVHGTNIANNFTGTSMSRDEFEEKMKSQPKRIGMKRVPVAESWPTEFHKINQ
jgi:hypothetical protein